MNTIETIQEKIFRLPPAAQKEVLEAVEEIETRYKENAASDKMNGGEKHPLTFIAELAKDVGVSDFSEKHDFYAHGKLED
jgi:hypothetical protein